MNAGDHCEIVLLDGAYPPFTVNTDRAGVTVRAVGEGVVVRAEGWHGGPLMFGERRRPGRLSVGWDWSLCSRGAVDAVQCVPHTRRLFHG